MFTWHSSEHRKTDGFEVNLCLTKHFTVAGRVESHTDKKLVSRPFLLRLTFVLTNKRPETKFLRQQKLLVLQNLKIEALQKVFQKFQYLH